MIASALIGAFGGFLVASGYFGTRYTTMPYTALLVVVAGVLLVILAVVLP